MNNPMLNASNQNPTRNNPLLMGGKNSNSDKSSIFGLKSSNSLSLGLPMMQHQSQQNYMFMHQQNNNKNIFGQSNNNIFGNNANQNEVIMPNYQEMDPALYQSYQPMFQSQTQGPSFTQGQFGYSNTGYQQPVNHAYSHQGVGPTNINNINLNLSLQNINSTAPAPSKSQIDDLIQPSANND